MPYKEMERLAEREHMMVYELGMCSYCGGQVKWGPAGGSSQNCACPSCKRKYVTSPLTTYLIGNVKIDKKGNIIW